jgi:methionyl-tRNA formyltransferase
VPQDESQATFCYQDDIAKEKAEVKFDTPVIQAERMVRAFYPWPVAWINQKSKIIDQKRETRRVKIFKARIADDIQLTASSLQLTAKDGRLFLCLADGCLELLELQLEGKQRRSAKDYLYLTD